ncbi:NEDD4-binding protein 2 [Anopheles nili]|uniref:NEDD4-binding protein 2 n=1 Tax=Anopheles nili TaxID=185578 RepID=UPI00237A353F|nr:NEDD4-binding protein 2 [Anopheles nili]
MCKDEILAHLTELFGDVIDQQHIIATIDIFEELETCIEALLQAEDQIRSSKKPLAVQKNKTVKGQEPLPIPTDHDMNGPDASTGATRKTTMAKDNPTAMPASFASLLQKGSFPTQFQQPIHGNSPRHQGKSKHQSADLPGNFQILVDKVQRGYRVMVLMRGAPGCGKSHLSRTLIDHTSGGDYRNHIFSTDDYFMVNGVYKFQADVLDAAHRYNQHKVLAKARDGWSPIIIDNTNIRLWEMYPYVQIAVDNGYLLDILEPKTHWRNNSRSLAIRNTHHVPESKIKSMLQNYEKLDDPRNLYILCNLEHALTKPAKMRHYPILPEDVEVSMAEYSDQSPTVQPQQAAKWGEEWESSTKETTESKARSSNKTTGCVAKNVVPKPPRDFKSIETKTSPRLLALEEESDLGAAGGYSAEDDFSWDFTEDWRTNDTNWKPYDTESNQFWGQSTSTVSKENQYKVPNGDDPLVAIEAQPQRTRALNPNHEPIAEFLLSSVKEPTKLPVKATDPAPKSPSSLVSHGVKEKASKKTDKKRIALIKHRRGCPNENASFSEICNLYPKVPESYLWDLFEKCSGDGDWVANLLLEEQKLENFESSTTQRTEENETMDDLARSAIQWNLLECSCNEPMAKAISPAETPTAVDLVENVNDVAEMDGNLITTNASSSAQSPRELARRGQSQRENSQVIKKEIEARFILGNEHFSEHIQKLRLARRIVAVDESSPEDILDLDTGDKTTDSEVVELRLGVELVEQLHALFKDKHCPKSLELNEIKSDRTRVFMATETAEQLYLLFLDSLYSYSEEEKLFSLRKDARMAKMMETEEKYPALFKQQDPSGVPNLKDIIEMEEALAAYQKETNSSWQKDGPPDLAQQMSQQKLKEMFPHVPGEDLVQILAAHNNRFDETVQVVNASIPETVRRQMLEKEELLKQRAENEKQKLLDLFSSPSFTTPSPTSSSEEAINFHLVKAEECRNLAQHHLDLKNECHEKARQAIQRSVPGLADYYSQIARLHRTKIDMYNSRASNCIMEVHKLKLNNAEVLDLHYLHSQEALRCLEMFLAEHASKLRSSQLRFMTLYIITGRGLHSTDGKPIIKQRVKTMLRIKNIRYTELNPGFLKIKLYNRDDLEQLMLMS